MQWPTRGYGELGALGDEHDYCDEWGDNSGGSLGRRGVYEAKVGCGSSMGVVTSFCFVASINGPSLSFGTAFGRFRLRYM